MSQKAARLLANYTTALSRITKSNVHVIDDKFLIEVWPYIQPQFTRKALLRGKEVAAPAMLVKGAYWRLTQITQYRLRCIVGRTPQSFLHPQASHKPSDVEKPDPAFLHEALGYDGWKLQPDTFPAAVHIRLCDPSTFLRSGGGITLYMASSFMTVTFRELLQLPSDEQAAAFNNALDYVDNNPLTGAERCGSSPDVLYYCSLCGHYLESHGCGGCMTDFIKRDDNISGAIKIAMPPKIIGAFKLHTFRQDPHQWLT